METPNNGVTQMIMPSITQATTSADGTQSILTYDDGVIVLTSLACWIEYHPTGSIRKFSCEEPVGSYYGAVRRYMGPWVTIPNGAIHNLINHINNTTVITIGGQQ
jgi:hypothetical protein